MNAGLKADPAGQETVDDGRILQLLGLARRAGRVAAGTQAVRDAGRRGSLSLVLVARDASDNAAQRVRGVLEDSGAGILRCGTLETLGGAVGRPGLAVVGVTDPGLAEEIGMVGGRGRIVRTSALGKQTNGA